MIEWCSISHRPKEGLLGATIFGRKREKGLNQFADRHVWKRKKKYSKPKSEKVINGKS